MEKDGIKKGFIYQMLYQIVILVLPLVISPYITRKLGSNSLGIYTYSNSIAYYFLLFCNLGIVKYGQRIVVESRDDEIKLRKTFWSLFFVHGLISIFVLIAYSIFVALFMNEYHNIYYIQCIYVASALFDITWLFYGLENFKSVVIKNTIIKLFECFLIFTLIKVPDDVLKYTLILSVGLFVGQILMIPQAIRTIPPIKVSFFEVYKHVKPMLILFISVAASTLYSVFDKTLLGILSPNISDVAYYEYAGKIILVPRSILAVIITVFFPKACEAVKTGNDELHKKYINDSMFAIIWMGVPFVFGLYAIANKLSLIYYGPEFTICGKIMSILSPIILIIYIAEVLRTEYLVAKKKDYIYIIGIVISAIINIIITILLIPILGVYGAVIGTLSAEIIGLVYVLFACRDIYSIFDIINSFLIFIVIGFVMMLVVMWIDRGTGNNFISLIFEVCVGGAIYLIPSSIILKKKYPNLWSLIIIFVRNKLSITK